MNLKLLQPQTKIFLWVFLLPFCFYGQTLETIDRYEWHNGQWNEYRSRLTTYTCDQFNRPIDISLFFNDETNSEEFWLRNKKTYSYDAIGQITFEEGLSYDDQGQLLSGKRIFRTIESLIQQDSVHIYSLDDNQWNPNIRITYLFEDTDAMADNRYYFYGEEKFNSSTQTWEPGTWQHDFSYDTEDRLIEVIEYYFDEIDQDYVMNRKEEITYDNNFIESVSLYYAWFDPSPIWYNHRKYDIIGSPQIGQETQTSYNGNFLDWNLSSIHEKEYDSNQYLTTGKIRFYDSFTSALTNAFKFNYERDQNGLLAEKLKETFIITNATTEEGYFENDYLDIYNYKMAPTSSTNLTNESDILINLYPNPVHDKLTIELQNCESEVFVKIYNSLGVLVHEQIRINETITMISTKHLAKGVYFLWMRSGEFIQTKTIIKD